MKIYIRSSMLPRAMDCMRAAAAVQFKAEILAAGYTLKEREPSVGSIIGSAAHVGSELAIGEYLNTGNYGKATDCIDKSISYLQSKIYNGVIWDSATGSKNEAEQQTKQMVNAYCIQIAPQIIPLTMPEKQMSAKIGDDIIFTGKNDIETIESYLRDTKTGSKIKSYHAQLGGYSLLRKALVKNETAKLFVDYMPRVSIKKPYPGTSIIEYDVTICERMAYDTILKIADSVRQFRDTSDYNAFPCNPASILCSAKYCTAYGTDFCKLF
jgi:hypothetical protein